VCEFVHISERWVWSWVEEERGGVEVVGMGGRERGLGG